MKGFRSSVAVLGIASLCAACGGGGGGGSGSPLSRGVASARQLLLTDVNASDTAIVTFFVAESLYQNADIMVSAAAVAQLNWPDSAVFTCDNLTGTVTIDMQDRDGSGTLSAGDRITIAYEDCDGIDGLETLDDRNGRAIRRAVRRPQRNHHILADASGRGLHRDTHGQSTH